VTFLAPIDVLPHRPPFLFVDRISALEPGVRAVGHWKLSGDEWFFSGHFPGRPTLPGVLMCEAIAQTIGTRASCRSLADSTVHGSADRPAQATRSRSRRRWGRCRLEPARAPVECSSVARSPVSATCCSSSSTPDLSRLER